MTQMDRLVRHWIPSSIAIIVFLLVLLGYVFPGAMGGLHRLLIEWAVVVAAFAFLLGVFNAFRTHIRRLPRLRQGGVFSLAFLFAALISLVLSLSGPEEDATRWVFSYVISPIGSSLGALVLFTLTMAAFRLLRTRSSERAKSVVFILVVAVVLLGGVLEPLVVVRDWFVNVLGMAGMRGLLLGVALGTVVTAFRVLWPRGEP